MDKKLYNRMALLLGSVIGSCAQLIIGDLSLYQVMRIGTSILAGIALTWYVIDIYVPDSSD